MTIIREFTIGGKGKHAHVYGLAKIPRQRSYRFAYRKAKGGFAVCHLSQTGTRLLARDTTRLFAADFTDRATKRKAIADRLKTLPKDRKARSAERKIRRQNRWIGMLGLGPLLLGSMYWLLSGMRRKSP